MSNKQIKYGIGFEVDESGLQKLKSSLQSLSQYKMDDLLKINTDATEQDLKDLQNNISIIQNALDQSYNFKLDSTNLRTFQLELQKSGTSLIQLQTSLNNAGPIGQMAFKNLAVEVFSTNQHLKQSHTLLDSMAKTLGNTIKWSIASSAINNITGSIQQAWGFTKSLDQSLTDIRIVTGQSADEMERFSKQAQKSAKALGTATTEYTNAALIYYQQGLKEEDVVARTDVTIKAANVTGQSAAEVSEQLTAVWNGYKVVAEEAELYVDKLAAVAASTAADLEELSTGMSKVASAAFTMGVDIDQLSAQLSTIVSVTRQDASLVGTALKTIYARMGDLKVSGIDEFGTSLGDVSSQLRQMGIDVLDQEGNLRDMGTVIEEVAGKWGSWTDAQRQAAAVAIAGKRQYNNLIALFDNWNMYESALITSQTSEGELQKQQNIYIDSLEGKLEQLGLAGEKIFDAMFDSESMKDLIEGLTKAAEIFAGFIDNIGGGGALLGHLGVIALNLFKNQIAGGIAVAWNNLSGMYNNTIENTQKLMQLEAQKMSQGYKENTQLQSYISLQEEQIRLSRFLSAEENAELNKQIQQVEAAKDQLLLAEQEAKVLKEQLDTAQKLLDTKKIYTTFDGKNQDDPNKVSGEQIRDEQGKFSSKYKFNLQTEAGRQEAANQIGTRLANLQEEEYATEEKKVLLDKPQSFETKEEMNTLVGNLAGEEEGTFVDNFIANYQGDPQDLETLKTANENLTEAVLAYKEAAKQTEEAEKALALARERGEDTTEAEKAVTEAFAQQQSAARTVTDRATRVANEQQQVIRKNKVELEDAQKALKTFTEQQKKAQQAIDKATNALKKTIKEHKKLQAAAKSKALITNITNTIAAVGSLASSVNSLIQVFDILNDTEMTGPEKALAVFQNLGMTIPMLIGSIGSVVTGITAMTGAQTAQSQALKLLNAEKQKEVILNSQASAQDMRDALLSAGVVIGENAEAAAIEKTVKSLTKKQTKQVLSTLLTNQNTAASTMNTVATTLEGEALECTGNKGLIAGLKIQAGFWPILAIGLAIIAVIGTIALLFAVFGKNSESAHEKAQKALKAEEEALSALQERYKEITEEINNTKNALEELREKQKIINGLTVGTEEWTKAVQDNNEQVLELLSNYTNLAPYLFTDEAGVLSISTEGEELLNKELEKKGSKARASVLGQQADVLAAKNRVILTNTDKNSGGTSIREFSHTDYNTGMSVYTNKSLAEIVQDDKIDDLAEILTKADNIQDSKALLKAMKDADIFKDSITADETLAQSLLDQADAVYNQISSTEANTNAIKALESAFVAEYYKENQDRKEAESISAWDAIAGYQAAQNAENATDLKTVNDEADSDSQDGLNAETQKYLADAWGVSVEDLDIDDDNNTVKIKGAADSTEISLSDAVDVARKQAGAARIEEQTAEITALVNKAHAAGGQLINLAGGKGSIAFDENDFTLSDLNKLDESKDAMFKALDPTPEDDVSEEDKENIAKQLGYDDYAAYEKAYYKTKINTQNTFNNLNKGNLNGFFDISNFSNATIAQAREISDAFETIFKSAGSSGAEALNSMLNEFSEDPKTQAKIASIASSINWMDLNAENEFRVALEDAGIAVNEMSAYWGNIKDAMESAANTAGAVAYQYTKIRNQLAEIKSLTEDLETGEIIDDEDYKNLIKYNSKLKDMFIQTADGYKFIGGSSKEAKELASKGYNDLNSLQQKYDALSASAKNFKNKEFEVSNTSATNIATAESIMGTTGWEDLLASQGINAEAYQKAYEIATKEGADTSSEKYKNAVADLKAGISAINQAKNDYDLGLFSADQALENWISYNASSWQETKTLLENQEIKDGNKIYEKFETQYKNQFLKELGLTLDSETVKNLDISKLEKATIAARKLELDYLQEINSEIKKNATLMEIVFGSGMTALLKKQIENQKDAYDITVQNKEWAKTVLNTALEGAGFEEGTTLTELLNARAAIEDPESAEAQNLDSLIEKWNSAEDAANAVAEASQAVIDAQIENYNYQLEMQDKITKSLRRIRDLAIEFDDFATEGLSVFEEGSAVDTIKKSLTALEDNRKDLGKSYEELSKYSKIATADLKRGEQAGLLEKITNQSNLEKYYEQEYREWYNKSTEARNGQNVRYVPFSQTNKQISNNFDLTPPIVEMSSFGSTFVGGKNNNLGIPIISGTDKNYNIIGAGNPAISIDPAWTFFRNAEDAKMHADTAKMLKDFYQGKYDYNENFIKSFFKDSDYNRFYSEEDGTFNEKAFEESFGEALDEAHETLISMREELQTLYDSYLQAQDEMLELYDKEIQKLSTINDIYSTMADLSVIVGENTSQYYSSIANNLSKSYSLAEQQYATAQAEYNKLFKTDEEGNLQRDKNGNLIRKDGISQEMYDKVADNLAAAANNLTDLAQQTLEAVANNFSAQIKEAVDGAIKSTAGLSLAAASESWELVNAANEGYLDEVNARYGMDQLSRKIQTSIDDTDNYAAQKKLADLRAKQEQRLNDILEERGKLSQYELDRANAEYELTLKQIALEEAQQTANKMKLTRDAMGNYTYQYVADQDAIAKAEEELAAAENNLYNIDKERNKSLVDEYYATMTEANEAIAEAMAQGDTERVERLREHYFGENGMIAGIQSELQASSGFLKEIGTLVSGKEFSDNITQVADQITSMKLSGEDGLFTKINELIGQDGSGIQALSDATETISDLLKGDGILQTVANSVSATQRNATDLATEVTELSNASSAVIDKLPSLVENVKSLADELDVYAGKYQAWLDAQVDTTEIEANTEALGDLTRSINELKDTLDNGKIDGSISVEGWSFDNNTWTQNANNTK